MYGSIQVLLISLIVFILLYTGYLSIKHKLYSDGICWLLIVVLMLGLIVF